MTRKFSKLLNVLMVLSLLFAGLPAVTAHAATSIDVPDTYSTATINAMIAAAAPFTEFVFDGDGYTGGYLIPETATDLTFTLKNGTVITAGEEASGACFFIMGDNTVIQAESAGGASCVSTTYSNAILLNWYFDMTVGNEVQGVVIDGLEIYAEPWTSTAGDILYSQGIYIDPNVSDLIIVDNYIHDTSTAILFNAFEGCAENVEIKGNMIQGQPDVIDYCYHDLDDWEYNPGDFMYDLTYNSWGSFTEGFLDTGDSTWPISYDPWTHAAIQLTPSKTTPIAVGDEITFDVVGVLKNITTATFTVEYDPAEFEFVGISDITSAFTPVPLQDLVTQTAGQIKFEGYTGTAVSSPTEAGTLLYKVTLKALTTGAHNVGINANTDLFGMLPPSGPSQNVFAASLDAETITVVDPLAVTAVDLMVSTDKDTLETTATPVVGSLASGFTMALDPAVPMYYFDADTITSNRPIANGSYPFKESVSGVEIFTLEVSDTGIWLRDSYANDDTPLRVQGYFGLGPYTYVGTVADSYGLTDEVSLTITFVDPFTVTAADMKFAYEPTGTYYTVAGDPTAGFDLYVDPTVEWYYLDTDTITSSHTLKNGMYPFNITGGDPNYPTFYLKVVGPEYTLIDGYQYWTPPFIESPLRINGNAVPTTYTYSGELEDLDGLTAEATIKVNVIDAVKYVQDNTTITGPLSNLNVTFPTTIPAVIDHEPYKINSRYTLGAELPAGSVVKVVRGTTTVYEGPLAAGMTSFWWTQIAGGSAADFDSATYNGATEHYEITVTGPGGNPLAFETTVKIESIISKDGFVTNTVLDAVTLPINIPADEAAALAWLQGNTVLSSVSGTIADLTATFPASIPPVIVAEDYLINSRMTLSGDAIPTGSTISILATVDGAGPFPYVTNAPIPASQFWVTELFDPDADAAGFNANYGGHVEIYAITINSAGGNPLVLNGSVKVESIISKDSFVTETVLDDITLTFTIPANLDVTDADLKAGTVAGGPYVSLGGNFATGFTMELDPAVEYYYLDVDAFVANNALKDGLYPFYIGTTPAGFFEYWAAKGVKAGATETWQQVMWLIINGTNPMFYVKVEGTTYTLIDGFQGGTNPLRINGSYFTGEYTFTGSLTDIYNTTDAQTIKVTFYNELAVTEVDLMAGTVSGGPYTALPGNLADGFTMVLNPAVEYYYLDVDAFVTNNALKDGLYPFTIASHPAIGFFEYWAAKGVVDGATGWQGQMWAIINGNAPLFYVKVDGTNYTLVDGLEYWINPLTAGPAKINGSYFTGAYTFTGSLTDKYDTTDTQAIMVTFTRANVPSVTGTVSMQGRTTRAGVLVTLTGAFGYGPYPATSINHISDNVTFTDLGLGEYIITVVQARYLDVTIALDKRIDLAVKHVIAALELKAGDANDNNSIDGGDASIIGTQYGTGTIESNGDVNFDGKVNIQDLALVGGNFYLNSASAYSLWVP